MNYKMIKNILGWLLIFNGAFMLIPLITGLIYGERESLHFLIAILICLFFGGILQIGKAENKALYSREGYVIVSLSWILLSVFGALPFYISGVIPSYTDALFETVSGFTTTGSSILSQVESIPKCMNMWRCFTNWIGGMGVLVFIMAFVPLSGGKNMHIMKAESTGPSVSKLVPRVKKTALILYSIYFILTISLFILLLLGKMNVYEALCTALATAGTGGFGIKNDSMGGYSSYIQIIVTIFMLIFSVNFGSYYLLLKGKLRDALNSEVRIFFLIVFAAITAISINIQPYFETIGEAVKHAAFTVATIISTSGFATTDYNIWPELSRIIIVLLMFSGGCAGSTSGGIKVSRIIILFKTMAKELETIVHTRQVKKITIDKHTIEHEVVRSVNVYMVCYVLIFTFSIIVVSFDNYDLITNFTAVAATLNNIGPGLDLVGPTQNFSLMSDTSKIVLIFDMLAGRLELFPMLLLFSPTTWKK